MIVDPRLKRFATLNSGPHIYHNQQINKQNGTLLMHSYIILYIIKFK